jgi:hypothetical protein
MASLIERFELKATEEVGFNPDSQRRCADMTQMTTHHVIREVRTVQVKRFVLPGLKEAVVRCYED